MRFPELRLFALDCPDPMALATFYGALTNTPVESWPGYDPATMPGIDLVGDSGPKLSFQRVANYVAPTWPDGPTPQQCHLDFLVDDLDEAEAFAISLGATTASPQPGTSFRVMLDPVGHPFCLCQRQSS